MACKGSLINKKYGVKIFIQKSDNQSRVPIASMMAVISLNIRVNDEVIISCHDSKDAYVALEEMEKCLTGKIDIEKSRMDEVDRVLDKSMITSELLIESIANGVIAVNEENEVILFNKSAEKITGISKHEIIGKKAHEMFENSKLWQVLKTGESCSQEKQVIENTTIITNRAPIVVEDKIVGGVAVFQDITEIEKLSNELESVMVIKERFGNILNYVNDGICMVDEKGSITYINPEYEKIWNIKNTDVLGKNIEEILPKSIVIEAIKVRKKQLGVIEKTKENIKVISNISPIFIKNTFKGVVIISREITELQKMIQKLNEAEEKIKYFQEELDRKQKIHKAFEIIIGKSGVLKDVLYIASKASKTSSTILIYGESGTGKEILARAVASTRKNMPFIRLNCAAIPENLLESELFGHVKGAFTGAIKDKLGKFELANGGTIFLDEIGDISKEMQVKLLRVLQEREFERVGGTQTIKVNIRLIAATNKNLEKMVKEGAFREDLYYRLNVIPVTLPPLRKRKGDIPLLVEHFIEKICKRENIQGKKITADVLEAFERYHWPGNIRELENIIERMIALSEEDILDQYSLPKYMNVSIKNENKSMINLIDGELTTLEAYEKQIIKLALEKYKSYNKAGKVLGITHRTVALKAKKYSLI